ncbi:MAG: molybdopterin adenylyltransferase [Chloroflexi bacterium]|nr:molybdopterin adenylyltransferase [Chloroflexota bacterium]
MVRVGILTVSDRSADGQRPDLGGPIVRQTIAATGAEVVVAEIVSDDRAEIEARLCRYADELQLDLVLTTGGTGVAPRDVTPDATLAVCQREVPGLGEAMRAASLPKTPFAMLSRATAGIRGRTLVVNLPGSPKGARECLEAIQAVLPHAVELIRGRDADHRPPSA